MPNKLTTDTENVLLRLLSHSIHNAKERHEGYVMAGDTDADHIIAMAKSHAVLSFVADAMADDKNINRLLSQQSKEYIDRYCESVILNGHKMLYLTDKYLKMLDDAGITGIVLKGWAVAGYYNVPELRKAGDIDILVAEPLSGKAVELLKNNGFREVEGQHSNHHVELENADGTVIEIHTTLVELFDDDRINEMIKEFAGNMLSEYEVLEYNGYRIRRAVPEYNAISLVLHMLQHYMRAGFGLKLLCDWVVFIENGINNEQYERFVKMAEKLGIYGFVTMINSVCIKYLKMEMQFDSKLITDDDLTDNFMADLLDGEEFGRSDAKRMVVINGDGIGAYAKEFHHQMIINNPQLSRHIYLWPYLWCRTLIVFLKNNKTIRKTKTMDIIKSAGLRGRMIKEMRLFDIKK